MFEGVDRARVAQQTEVPSAVELNYAVPAFFLILMGAALWQSTIHVHAIGVLEFSDLQVSLLFSLVSVPGLLAVLLPKVSAGRPVSTIVVSLCLLVAVALLAVSSSQLWAAVALGSFGIAMGQVLIYPVACALSAERSGDAREARIGLAQLRSYGPLAVLSASMVVLFVLPQTNFTATFSSMALVLLLCGVLTWFLSNRFPSFEQRTKIRIERRLWPYYLLNFLSGSRSVLFKAFVIALLVRNYEFDMSHTGWLILSSSLAGFVGYRLFALLSRVFSARAILACVYLLVGLLFCGFAVIKIPSVLVGLFLIDSLVFGVSVVTDGTLKSVVEPGELANQLATGVTIFHAAGVLVPLVGGAIASISGGLTGVFFFAAAVSWAAAIVSQIHCRLASQPARFR